MSLQTITLVHVKVGLDKVTAFQDGAQLQYRTKTPVEFKKPGTYCIVFHPTGAHSAPADKEKDSEAGAAERKGEAGNNGSAIPPSSSPFPPSPHDRIWSEMDTDSLQVRLVHQIGDNSLAFSRLLLRDVKQRTRVVEDPVATEVQEKKSSLREVTAALASQQQEVQLREGSLVYLSQIKESMIMAMRNHQPDSLLNSDPSRSPVASPVENFRMNPKKWVEMANFISSKSKGYRGDIVELQEEIAKLRKREKDIREALSGLREAPDTHLFFRSRVETVVEATVDWLPSSSSSALDDGLAVSLCVGLQLSFMAPGVRWEPVYDVRVHLPSRTMEIGYFANISQQTGVPWEEVVLCLSTARPRVGASPPVDDRAWHISLHPPPPPPMALACCRAVNFSVMARNARPGAAPNGISSQIEDMDVVQDLASEAPIINASDEDDGGPPQNTRQAKVRRPIFRSSVIGNGNNGGDKNNNNNTRSGRAATFTIAGRVSIPSEANHPVRVCIMVEKLPMTLKFTCTPKLDPLVYLHAHGVNSTPYEWLSGAANVYYNQTFVCRTTLPYTTGGGAGKIKIALGADEDSVKVKRTKVDHRIAEGLRKTIFSSATHTAVHYAYQFEVTPEISGAEISIIDQYPVSTHEEMKVELKEPSISNSKATSPSTKQHLRDPQAANEGSAKDESNSFASTSVKEQEGETGEEKENADQNMKFFIRPGLTGTVNPNDHTVTWTLKDPPQHEIQRFSFAFQVQYPENKFLPFGLDG